MIIGITGGIGSGKSTIAQELARRGYAVYDCDREAKRIIAEDEEVRQAVIDLLGSEAFRAVQNGKGQGTELEYNTAFVAKRVFAEPDLLKKLNEIVHPAVIRDIRQHSVPGPNSAAVLFVESAILYEAGLDGLCDRIIVVEAPDEVRLARTIARDYNGIASPENINKVRARMRTQVKTVGSEVKCLFIRNDGKTPIPALVDKIIMDL